MQAAVRPPVAATACEPSSVAAAAAAADVLIQRDARGRWQQH